MSGRSGGGVGGLFIHLCFCFSSYLIKKEENVTVAIIKNLE